MIRAIILRNAGPFRGDHVVELGPVAYALTGRYDADPGRSNWSGKSFLLEMVEYALTGKTAASRAFDADGWITRGETAGRVELVLEDGAAIVRERRRGKPTQSAFTGAAGKATQAEADAAVLNHIGFSADDFRNVAYFEQGMMTRFVRTEPSHRMEIVRGWFGMETAEQAVAVASARVRVIVDELEPLRARRTAIVGMLEDVPALATEPLVAARDALAQKLAYERERAGEAEAVAAAEAAIAEYNGVVRAGKQATATLAGLPDGVDAAAASAREASIQAMAAAALARREVGERARVARGEFDGRCPVADIECPARARINADRSGAASVLARAREKHGALANKAAAAAEAAEELAALAGAKRDAEHTVERLRASAREMLPKVKAAQALLKHQPQAPALDALALASLEEEHARAVRAVADAEAARDHRARLESKLLKLNERVRWCESEMMAAAAAASVFRAAQRRIGERALAGIVDAANATMAGSGIDLSVAARWERSGKSAARACEVCGRAFPATLRVRECACCGAERGAAVVRRLDFELSDRSGAADGIAGVALQLAAGAWLLRKRQSPWATAMLDEPLAACDRTNRRALAGQLVRLLGAGTWRQAIVVSHSNDVVDMYPGRIEVVVGRDGARAIRVTA